MTKETYFTIGKTVELLQQEFPNLSPSSLRFLEREGLLHPQRTTGGHRLYSDQDVARIRLIKRLQSERRYPLETIRHMLVKLERAKDIEAEMAFLESLYSPLSYDPNFAPLTREELTDRTGFSPSDIARLEEIGLVFPYTNGNGRRRYDEDDLKMAELVAEEVKRGANLDDFAPYAVAMRALVQEEFNLFYKLAGEELSVPERGRQLKETADVIHAVMRAKLTRLMMMQAKHNRLGSRPD